jgi:hypothetical protein
MSANVVPFLVVGVADIISARRLSTLQPQRLSTSSNTEILDTHKFWAQKIPKNSEKNTGYTVTLGGYFPQKKLEENSSIWL